MSKWIDLETDASTGKPYLWKCDECGEEVETKWNYCPECGDPKTSKGKSINTLVKALEAEHKKLREMQSATDKNVGTKISREPLELARVIDGLTEWQKHVQTDSNIDRDITVAIEALKAQLSTNLAEVGTDCISRQAAIDLLKQMRKDGNMIPWEGKDVFARIRKLPPAQPEIIRCRNCKFASGDSRICMKFGHSPIGELDFCAWAERRTDEE